MSASDICSHNAAGIKNNVVPGCEAQCGVSRGAGERNDSIAADHNVVVVVCGIPGGQTCRRGKAYVCGDQERTCRRDSSSASDLQREPISVQVTQRQRSTVKNRKVSTNFGIKTVHCRNQGFRLE